MASLLKESVYYRKKEKLGKNKEKQARYYNKETKELKDLKQGYTVRIEPKEKDRKWTKARVDGPVNIRSYRVKTEEGRTYSPVC